eukprot:m.252054 g.252054  ORF g.252054 m.252054 type:complete len:1133 (+) comp40345_c0_seq5:68-3466(+)
MFLSIYGGIAVIVFLGSFLGTLVYADWQFQEILYERKDQNSQDPEIDLVNKIQSWRTSANSNRFSSNVNGFEKSFSVNSCPVHNFAFSSKQETEQKILLKLFEDLNGNDWYNHDRWNTPAPHCNCWTGIYCHTNVSQPDFGLVSVINLTENNMVGHFPKSVLNLTALTELWMSRNRIQGNLTEMLAGKENLTRIQRLDFSFNEISGTVPWDVLQTWTSLQKLELGYNSKLTGIIGEEIGTMTQLEVLSLGKASIGGQLPRSIGKLVNVWFLDLQFLHLAGDFSQLLTLTKLVYLHLVQNNITGTLPNNFSAIFPNLTEFSAPYNKLSGTLPNVSKNLTVFNVKRNKFHGHIPFQLMNLTQLKFLDLSHNYFTSISLEVNLPRINFLILENNQLNLSMKNVTKMFACHQTVLSCVQRWTLAVLDLSSTGIHGRFQYDIWRVTNMLVLDLSGNNITGECTDPFVVMVYLQTMDLSHNSLEGEIPSSLSMFESIRTMNFKGNPEMRSPNLEIPWFTEADNTTMEKENESDNFTCPLLRIRNSKGVLTVDSAYYHRSLCRCLPTFYGNNGTCLPCPDGGTCQGNATDSKIVMDSNRWPSPSPTNVSTLVLCSSVYKDTFQCNPSKNCTCWLEDDGDTACDSACICLNHTEGRVCSQCDNSSYKDGNRCLPCRPSQERLTHAATGIAFAMVALFLIAWLVNLIARIKEKGQLFSKLLTFFLSIFVLLVFLLLGDIPSYVAEMYVIFVIIATIDILKGIKVLVTTFVVYLQILDAMHVSAVQVQCRNCSFVFALERIHLYKAFEAMGNVLNFRFSGLACVVPELFKPLPKLLLVSTLPLLLGTLLLLGRLFDFVIFSCCKRLQANERKELCKKVVKEWTRHCVSILSLCFFPVLNSVLKVFLPCNEDSGENKTFMEAFPSIARSSTQYMWLLGVAVIVFVAYAFVAPIALAVALWKHNSESCNKNRDFTPFLTLSENGDDNEHEKSVMYHLCVHYRPPYNKFMAVFLMIRRLVIAMLLALPSYDNRDVQSVFFNFVMLLLSFAVASTWPYRGRWENFMDLLLNGLILLTFNSLTNRDSETGTAATIAMFLNLVVICICVLLVLVKIAVLLGIRCRSRKEEGDPQERKKLLHASKKYDG